MSIQKGIPALAGMIICGLACTSHGQVTLSDMGTTAPATYDTGHLGTLDNRYSFDGPISPATTPVDSHGQSFTPATTGKLEFLHLAYNAGGIGTFQVFIDTAYAGGGNAEIINDATAAGKVFTIDVASFIAGPNGLSGLSTDTNTGPGYWFRLDFSNETVGLTAGQQAAFFFRAISETASDSSFIFAPRYHLNDQVGETDEYPGGATVNGSNFAPAGSGHDLGFAVEISIDDTDADDLPDYWELSFPGVTGLSDLNGNLTGPGPGAGTGDFDGDGLSDLDEFGADTDPTLADSDTDGLPDGNEVDGENASGVSHGFGPTEPNEADSDDDDLSDGQETAGHNALGVAHGFGPTNPNNIDTDADQMDDLYEVTNNLNGGLNPNLDDASGNLDADTGNPQLSTSAFTNLDEYLGSYTNGVRTRADKADTDSDNLPDTAEENSNVWSGIALTGTNPVFPDTDGDGLLDGQENPDLSQFPGTGVLPTNSNPNLPDTDFDTLRDAGEVALGTNPADPDTDDDTYDDKVELLNGSDPKLASSIPASSAVMAGSDFTHLSWLQTGVGVTSSAASPLLSGSAENGLFTANSNNAGAMVSFANPNGITYYSVDLRYTGTLDGQGINVISANTLSVQTSANTHCGIRFLPDGSIGYFNGATLTAGAPAGTHVAGTTYTVQFVHDIPNNVYTIRVYDRSNSNAVIFQVTPAVPTRNQAPGGTLYFGSGIQQDSTNGFELRIDNLFVSTAPIAPGTVVTPAAPVITGIVFVGDDLKISFSPGGAGYILSSSNNLTDPFVVEPAAIYDNAGTFTVPAAALNPGRDFFRVETAP
jgi:hypothetical protein